MPLILPHIGRLALVLTTLAAGAAASAQTSSLYQRYTPEGQEVPLTLENSSWSYRQLPPPKELRMNDLVTIRVDVSSQTTTEGDAQIRRNLLYDAILRDWVILKGIDEIKPSGQSGGNPRANGTINGLFRAQSQVETTENVKFNITATVADIRPNGTLVLEAHTSVQVNDMHWEYSLSGICRPQDIGPDNVLLSQNISELSVYKRERGQIRDAYRRGWLLSWWDSVRLF
jgi:flagellar L-ring protein precursor FlgH